MITLKLIGFLLFFFHVCVYFSVRRYQCVDMYNKIGIMPGWVVWHFAWITLPRSCLHARHWRAQNVAHTTSKANKYCFLMLLLTVLRHLHGILATRVQLFDGFTELKETIKIVAIITSESCCLWNACGSYQTEHAFLLSSPLLCI